MTALLHLPGAALAAERNAIAAEYVATFIRRHAVGVWLLLEQAPDPAGLAALGDLVGLAAATRRKHVAVLQTLVELHDVNPVTRWQHRLDAAKDSGLARQDIHALGAVRCAALRSTPPRGPDEIHLAWAAAVLSGLSAPSSRHRFRRGMRLLNATQTTR